MAREGVVDEKEHGGECQWSVNLSRRDQGLRGVVVYVVHSLLSVSIDVGDVCPLPRGSEGWGDDYVLKLGVTNL